MPSRKKQRKPRARRTRPRRNAKQITSARARSAGTYGGTSRVTIEFPTAKYARAIADALAPEARHPAGQRAEATVTAKGKTLGMTLLAKDSVSLRAIVTSYIRMLKAASAALQETSEPRASRKDNKH